eukprot:CAMPEP_0184371004 /NCGR_PEP_ID=MMETSP1089-20130417/163153_1 /TAXON_ID=38269 ORGANISM="Gloeochaete wittrockiana, Strain SAG46.84" /NCGR_SAMPLE_ID=MMETSP1089 /ASSEMBLY_ACC=CAM_ASM_000445 /LENGTH=322 /DNA_ID=CAMNT_0026713703 /DNA_START=59 /DNA_END=1027 /DNA_ORIENTATION=+
MGRSNNLTVKLVSFIVGEDDTADAIRRTIVRYLCLAHAMIYKQAAQLQFHHKSVRGLVKRLLPSSLKAKIYRPREKLDLIHQYRDLFDQNLITTDEWDALAKVPGKFQVVYSWILQIITECARSDRLMFPATTLPNLQEDLTVLRGSAADIFMIIGTQIPFAYVHLLTLLTRLHIVFVTLYCSSLLAQGFQNRAIERLLLGYFVLAVNYAIYNGLLNLHDELVNPFGNDPHDFPHRGFQASLNMSTHAALEQGRNPPAFIKQLKEHREAGILSPSTPSTQTQTPTPCPPLPCCTHLDSAAIKVLLSTSNAPINLLALCPECG